MWEFLLVVLVVVAALVYIGWTLYRRLRGERRCGGSCSDNSCPFSQSDAPPDR